MNEVLGSYAQVNSLDKFVGFDLDGEMAKRGGVGFFWGQCKWGQRVFTLTLAAFGLGALGFSEIPIARGASAAPSKVAQGGVGQGASPARTHESQKRSNIKATPVFPEDALAKLKSFTQLREKLAETIPEGQPITPETFQATCGQVGKAMKAWSTESGYRVRQIAVRYRNPAHEAKGAELKALEQLIEKPALTHLVAAGDGEGKFLGLVRIPVAQSCLKCHGPRESRPEFIQAKYPQDRAFDFKVGDLRGAFLLEL
jgi:hypothetical protein